MSCNSPEVTIDSTDALITSLSKSQIEQIYSHPSGGRGVCSFVSASENYYEPNNIHNGISIPNADYPKGPSSPILQTYGGLGSVDASIALSPLSDSHNEQQFSTYVHSSYNTLNASGLTLHDVKIKNQDRVIIGHLNINHLVNKFEPLMSLIKDKLAIFLLTETKISESSPTSQFKMDGYSTEI